MNKNIKDKIHKYISKKKIYVVKKILIEKLLLNKFFHYI